MHINYHICDMIFSYLMITKLFWALVSIVRIIWSGGFLLLYLMHVVHSDCCQVFVKRKFDIKVFFKTSVSLS